LRERESSGSLTDGAWQRSVHPRLNRCRRSERQTDSDCQVGPGLKDRLIPAATSAAQQQHQQQQHQRQQQHQQSARVFGRVCVRLQQWQGKAKLNC